MAIEKFKDVTINGVDYRVGLVTALVGRRGLPNGARLWMTHATVAAEDPACPELVTTPTRRLVSHTGVDATRVRTVPAALRSQPMLLQWAVVAVDVPSTFGVVAGDLYPSPRGDAVRAETLLVRNWHGPACIDGADAVASGCVEEAAISSDSSFLFEARTDLPNATTCDICDHRFALWLVFPVPNASAVGSVVVLGDLTKTVSLSGYRFRLQTNATDTSPHFVVVGAPEETVDITYLVRDSSLRLIVGVRRVVIPPGGRALVDLLAK